MTKISNKELFQTIQVLKKLADNINLTFKKIDDEFEKLNSQLQIEGLEFLVYEENYYNQGENNEYLQVVLTNEGFYFIPRQWEEDSEPLRENWLTFQEIPHKSIKREILQNFPQIIKWFTQEMEKKDVQASILYQMLQQLNN